MFNPKQQGLPPSPAPQGKPTGKTGQAQAAAINYAAKQKAGGQPQVSPLYSALMPPAGNPMKRGP